MRTSPVVGATPTAPSSSVASVAAGAERTRSGNPSGDWTTARRCGAMNRQRTHRASVPRCGTADPAACQNRDSTGRWIVTGRRKREIDVGCRAGPRSVKRDDGRFMVVAGARNRQYRPRCTSSLPEFCAAALSDGSLTQDIKCLGNSAWTSLPTLSAPAGERRPDKPASEARAAIVPITDSHW